MSEPQRKSPPALENARGAVETEPKSGLSGALVKRRGKSIGVFDEHYGSTDLHLEVTSIEDGSLDAFATFKMIVNRGAPHLDKDQLTSWLNNKLDELTEGGRVTALVHTTYHSPRGILLEASTHIHLGPKDRVETPTPRWKGGIR